MLLTQAKISAAKPKETDSLLRDGNGLFLLIKTTGSKLWRYRRTIKGKQVLRGLGKYPEISLAEARERCASFNQMFANNVDPLVLEREQAREAQNTFETLAREWHQKQTARWSPDHAKKVIYRLEKEIFPYLGNTPINRISPQDILRTLRIMENRRATDLAHRMLQTISQIFRYGIATGLAERDHAADLKGALTPVRHKHHASAITAKEIAQLMRDIENYKGSHTVRCALRLSPHLFVRPGELRHAEWSEIDFLSREWRIPAGKMKMKSPHIVPLSEQTLAIFNELKPLTGNGKLVFPGRTSAKPMSENTIGAALRYLGYSSEQQTAHGFRSMASSYLNESGKWNSDAIERQLAHAERNKVRAAYNHADYLEERRRMMQWWSDELDRLKACFLG